MNLLTSKSNKTGKIMLLFKRYLPKRTSSKGESSRHGIGGEKVSIRKETKTAAGGRAGCGNSSELRKGNFDDNRMFSTLRRGDITMEQREISENRGD